MKEKILLDTDIGSDIDDAVCLAYLLAKPECDLLGVTSVSGDTRTRAALADAICRAAGRTGIPIRAGCGRGITTGEVVQPDCNQAPVLKHFEHRDPADFRPNEAVTFLRETIYAHPGEVTLLAIGPMTNLGVLFAMDPEIPGFLKRLVLMCGIFNNSGAAYKDPCYAEWNARCDPMAARIVYRTEPKEHRSCGLDVTTKCTMSAGEVIAKFSADKGPLKVVAEMMKLWGKRTGTVTFHDPLAAVCVFKPDICEWMPGKVSVEVGTQSVDGMTVLDTKSDEKPHLAASGVDSKAFFKEYFDTVLK